MVNTYSYLFVVPLGPAVRKSTSLQTQKKEEETRKWASTPKDDVSAIQKAMAEENKVATATRTQSRARTAPNEETKVSCSVLYFIALMPSQKEKKCFQLQVSFEQSFYKIWKYNIRLTLCGVFFLIFAFLQEIWSHWLSPQKDKKWRHYIFL